MDLKTYVQTNIVPYLDRDDKGDFILPEIDRDISYFSDLHSWYKHFRGKAQKVYPILKLGREPRNGLSDDVHEDDEDNKLHWWFVIDIEKDEPKWWNSMCERLPIDSMKKYHVHLSSDFSHQGSDLFKFHKLALTTECLGIWDEIKSYF